jgi:hypothetical protein
MADIAKLGYDIQTGDVDAAGAKLDQFAAKNTEAASSAKQVGSAAKRAGADARSMAGGLAAGGARAAGFGNNMRGAGAHTANLTAQLNDIGVMLAAGQNPLQLALQQGTQVNQVFSQLGGGANAIRALGGAFVSMINPLSLATIGIIAGGAALVQWGMRAAGASDEAEEFSDKLEEIADRAKAAKQELRADIRGVSLDELALLDEMAKRERELSELRSAAAEASSGRSRRNAELRVQYAQEELDGIRDQLLEIRKIEETRARVLENTNKTAEAERLMVEQMQVAARERAAATEQAQNTLVQLRRQASIQQAIARYGSDSLEVASLRASAEREANAELVRGMNISEDLKEELLNAWEAARGISDVDLSPGISAAAQAAMSLADQLGISLQRALRMQGMISNRPTGDVFDPRDPRNSGADAATERARRIIESGELRQSSIPSISRSSGGGGGGGGGSARQDTFAADLESLRNQLLSERQIIEEQYAIDEALLNDRRAREVLGEQEHKAAMLALEEQYHSDIREVRDASNDAALTSAAGLFGGLAAISAQGGEGLVRATRTFAAAEALINAWRAHNQTLADPSLPFFAKIPAALSVLGSGLGVVNAIKGGGSSGSGVGASGISAAPAAQEQQAPQRIILQGLDKDALLTGEMVSKIFDGIFDENKRRGGVIVVST